jgi:hypothetical protein
MTNKIILFITILVYGMAASQSFMYIFALKNVQLNLEANAYIELRKVMDISMNANFKYVMYSALLGNLLLVISNFKNTGSLLFITSAIAFIAIIADSLIAVKGNIPINTIISTWSPDNYPANWSDYRAKWLSIFQYRQIANITGFASLSIGAVFGLR